jgi:hypothetical protein
MHMQAGSDRSVPRLTRPDNDSDEWQRFAREDIAIQKAEFWLARKRGSRAGGLTRFGAAAVERLHRESHGVLVGLQKSAITSTPLLIVIGRRKGPDQSLFRLAEMLVI